MDGDMPVLHKNPAFDIGIISKISRNLQRWDSAARAILFGSRASHTNRWNSDYDIVFLSDKFSSWSQEERYILILSSIRPPSSRIALDAFCFTNAEWQSMEGTTFFEEVRLHGVELSLMPSVIEYDRLSGDPAREK